MSNMVQNAVRLPEDVNQRLVFLAKQTKRTKAFYIREALDMYLEDLEDAYTADVVYKRVLAGKETLYSADEVKKELGLDD